MNLDIVESVENSIKFTKRYTDNVYEQFFNEALKGSITRYDPLVCKYFKFPEIGNMIPFKNSINYNNICYNFVYYIGNDEIKTIDYFKDDIEIKEINYLIKNFPNFVKLMISCKKNDLIIKSIKNGIIKIGKELLIHSYIYCNIELFKTLIQMDNNCIDCDLVRFLSMFILRDYIKWDMFEFMVNYLKDKLPVNDLILEETLIYNKFVYNLLIEKVIIKREDKKRKRE